MRTLILFLFLMVSFQFAKAAELPLLNLEIGKTYRIETIMHIDTSEQWLHRSFDQRKWLLTPVKLENGIYTLELVLDFYKIADQEKTEPNGWRELRCYETGYSTNLNTPLVFLNKTKAPIQIQITRDGQIENFDFTSYNQNQNRSTGNFEEYQALYNKFTNEIQQLFFIVPFGNKDNRWEDADGIYNLESEDKNFIRLNYKPITIKENNQEFVNRSIVLDKKTGLIQREYYNYRIPEIDFYGDLVMDGGKNSTMYFQKYVPVQRSSAKVFDSKYWKQEKNDTVNASLKGVVVNPISGNDSILIFISNDSYIFLPLDSKGNFEATFNLNNFQEMEIVYPIDDYGVNERSRVESNYPYSRNACRIGLSSGDNVEIYLNSGSSLKILQVSGIGYTEFNLNKEWRWNGDIERVINPFNHSAELYNARNKMDPSVYLYRLFELQYFNLRRPDYFDKDYPQRILISNSLATNCNHYLMFLSGFIGETLNGIIEMNMAIETNQNFTDAEKNYYLGQYLLIEPVRSNYLFDYVYGASYGFFISFDLRRQLSESFLRNFSTSPLYDKLNYHYTKFMEIAPGKRAPGFQLETIDGEKISLTDLKGKVVVLDFVKVYNIKGKLTYNFLKPMDYVKEYLDDKTDEIIVVNVFSGSRDSIQKFFETNSVYGINTIDDSYPYSKLYEAYQVNSKSNSFIIDRNGNIVSCNYSYGGQFKKDIEKSLSIPYKSENEFPIWLRITLIALIGALLALFLTFILYRNISRRKLKKSELNKKMRELELTAIRAQMNPHFMYNCLNSIQNLVQKQQNDEAHLYLSKFASLIRRTLNTSKKEEISLAEELETIQEYIDLEKLRFEFNYQLVISPEIEINSVFVPPMLLQPYVENALLHGLLPKSTPRVLKMNVFKKDKKICIDVEDNGVGRQNADLNGSSGNKKGLALNEERLKLLEQKYNVAYHFEIIDLKDENGLPLGTRVSLCFFDE